MDDDFLRTVRRISDKLGGNHIYSSLSCADILRAIFHVKDKNDVVLLSKGHAAPALYAVLMEMGLIDEEEIEKAGTPSSRLQTHPERGTPGVLLSSGSLGQGLSMANGIALAAKMDGVRRRIFVVLGDGELDEGQIWEAAATTATYELNNVIAIVDRNGRQLTGPTHEIKIKEPLAGRWSAFGWRPVECSGSPEEEILRAIDLAEETGRPTVLIFRAVNVHEELQRRLWRGAC